MSPSRAAARPLAAIVGAARRLRPRGRPSSGDGTRPRQKAQDPLRPDGKKVPLLPDVPTLGEQGVTGGEAYGFVGLIAPKKIPEPVLAKLREVTKKITEDKEFINVIEKRGDDVKFITGDEVKRIVDYETEKRAQLFKRLIKEQAEVVEDPGAGYPPPEGKE